MLIFPLQEMVDLPYFTGTAKGFLHILLQVAARNVAIRHSQLREATCNVDNNRKRM